ncbi:sperm flagellar protein 1-like isoform X5 [Dreissena polymorpha]|uniref:sperm flagellar protein 1-like isoform X5 n=1 Tax=Dreissena polymorpha TaxID=45954 RepID=UPI0022655B28|nr:sperm flagellar protein 1-like isoform X5 [Dreissena polymorpha]
METITARKDLNGMTKVDMEEYFDDVEVESLYSWIDRIPLSRPKKNISKDFSDAVLCAEVIKHYFPRMVETHNYTPAASTKQKLENWYLLNRRVLRRLELDLSDDVLRALANGKPKVIERVLMLLRLQIDKMLEKTDTPPGIKSPRGPDSSSRSLSPNRLTKSEGAAPSPRKYQKGEIPHGHPDRTREIHSDYHHRPPNPGLEALAFDYPFTHFAERSYFADKPLPLVPKPFLPAVDNVPRILFEEKEMECQAKQETIQILEAKIRRLNHLLHLKDVRIDDLHNTLQQTVGFGYSSYRKT